MSKAVGVSLAKQGTNTVKHQPVSDISKHPHSHSMKQTTLGTSSTNIRHQSEQRELKTSREQEPGGDSGISGRVAVPRVLGAPQQG